MKTFLLVVAAISVPMSIAVADTYNYSCKICSFPAIANGGDGCDADGKMFPLRVNDSNNVLEWRGKKYSITVASADEPNGCAKNGWHAEGNGTSFTFCAATQGYGAIQDKTGDVRVQCNLKR